MCVTLPYCKWVNPPGGKALHLNFQIMLNSTVAVVIVSYRFCIIVCFGFTKRNTFCFVIVFYFFLLNYY